MPATLSFPPANSLLPFKSLESRVLDLIGPKDPWDKLFSPRPRFHRLTRGPGRLTSRRRMSVAASPLRQAPLTPLPPQERPLGRRPALRGGDQHFGRGLTDKDHKDDKAADAIAGLEDVKKP